MEAVVELEGVWFRYRGSGWVLRGVSMRAPRGLTVVTGPTGSGKTTLLRVVSGAAVKVHGGELRGRVEVAGRPVLVPQEFDEFLIMPSVWEDLEYAAEKSGAGVLEARRAARAAAEALGVDHLLYRRVSSLSLGERQRVALAAALAMGAEVLLLDEPLAHQDEEGARLLIKALSKPQFEAVIAAEHRISLIASEADWMVYMEDGSVEAEGPPSEVAPRAAASMDPLAWRLEACREACRR